MGSLINSLFNIFNDSSIFSEIDKAFVGLNNCLNFSDSMFSNSKNTTGFKSSMKSNNGDFEFSYEIDGNVYDVDDVSGIVNDICSVLHYALAIANPKSAKIVIKFINTKDGNQFVNIDWVKETKTLYMNKGMSDERFFDVTEKMFIPINSVAISSGKNSCVDCKEIDNSCDQICQTKEYKKPEIVYDSEKDENKLAFNLKNRLDKELENNTEDDEYAGECEYTNYFCPTKAIEMLKYCLGGSNDETFDVLIEGGDGKCNGLVIDIRELYNENDASIDYIYHNESFHLDTFCELACERLGFSKVDWDYFHEDNNADKKITDIVFTLLF